MQGSPRFARTQALRAWRGRPAPLPPGRYAPSELRYGSLRSLSRFARAGFARLRPSAGSLRSRALRALGEERSLRSLYTLASLARDGSLRSLRVKFNTDKQHKL